MNKKIGITVGVTALLLVIILGIRLKTSEVKNFIEIKSSEKIEVPVKIENVMLDKKDVLYSSDSIKKYKKNIDLNSENGEYHIILSINNIEKEIMGYVDSNNKLLQIVVDIKKVTETEITVQTEVKTSIDSNQESFTFSK